MVKYIGLILSFWLMAGCITPPALGSDYPISFVVIGDSPYSPQDKIMLQKARERIRTENIPFVIHIGDYKGGGAECTPDHDLNQLRLIKSLEPLPVFYTPGDNEWTDCDRFDNPVTGKKYSELTRLDTLRSLFFAKPPSHADMFAYRRQSILIENATWKLRGVRFMTLHITGTNNSRDWVGGDTITRALSAVSQRDTANLIWLDHIFSVADTEKADALVIAIHGDVTDIKNKPEGIMCTDVAKTNEHDCDAFVDFRNALHAAAQATSIPILLIHGDTAPFTLNQKLAGIETPNLWRLNAAGDAGIGRTGHAYGVHDVTHVTVDPKSAQPFTAIGLVTRQQPKK